MNNEDILLEEDEMEENPNSLFACIGPYPGWEGATQVTGVFIAQWINKSHPFSMR